jgi:hypothetical protein
MSSGGRLGISDPVSLAGPSPEDKVHSKVNLFTLFFYHFFFAFSFSFPSPGAGGVSAH